jgi:hypothetical protein
MKFKFLKPTLSCLVLMNSSIVSASFIPSGGFGLNSNFIDNGNITTEYRADGTVLEWLDLTVTNGLSFNSVAGDFADDNILNRSFTPYVSNSGARNDVDNLLLSEATGWSTVNDLGVVDLFNAFFGLSLTDGETISGNTLVNAQLIEDFIYLFGDTYHEGLRDRGYPTTDTFPSIPNIGETSGTTSSYYDTGRNENARVSDGQKIGSSTADTEDYITTGGNMWIASGYSNQGTWANRAGTPLDDPIPEVPEPTTFLMFSLALAGLVIRRRKVRS